ncbi:MAG: MerR family transcriptional regulator [Clostridia bacterium]|nr:MerR family transcriptional regulator [Clostridia bacterium]
MTIKQFARLCGCNPQTLRYYDHVGLLKPIKVDQWSGYRYYEEEQALDFVKIKNLQTAGFSIEEIKALLGKDHSAVREAFDAKIAEQEKRLREIHAIRQSYLAEMKQLQEKIRKAKDIITLTMREYDAQTEFGIDAAQYEGLIDMVSGFFDNTLPNDLTRFDLDGFLEGGKARSGRKPIDFLKDADYQLLYEKHGWDYVKDFLDDIGALEGGGEYALCFRLNESKTARSTAFANTVLGILLLKNPGRRKTLACEVEKSEDGKNHFWFLKKKSLLEQSPSIRYNEPG